MPIDPNIALSVRPAPTQDPLQTVGALMQLKNQQGEAALRAAQLGQANANTADIQAQAQQRNRDLADQNTIQSAMQDPDTAKAFGAGDLSALNGKVQPKSLAGLQTQILAQQQKISEKSKADLDLHTEQLGQVATGLAGLKLLAADNPDSLPTAYAQWRNTVTGAKIVGPDTLPPQITSAKDLDNIGAVTGAFLGMHQKVQADQAEAQKIKTDASTEAMNTAHAGQFDADAAKLIQDKATAVASLPSVQAKAQNDAADAAFKAAHGGRSAEEIAQNSETARHNRADEATAAGELGIKTKTFDATYGPNAVNQGLAGVQPHLIGPATAAITKAGEDLASATTAADSMNKLLDLAAKGNKAAGSNLPLVGVETLNALNGIKRINSAEISQYGGAGSLLDQVKGKIGKLAVGQPIPQDVMDDIREMHTELATGAQTTFDRKRQVINQTYNSKFGPVDFGGAAAASMLPPQAKAQLQQGHDTTFANGQVWTLGADGKEKQIK